MGTFSVKGIDVTIGDWRWDGFAPAQLDSPLVDKRRVSLAGGPSWERDEPIDEDWVATVLPVSHVVRRGIEGAQLARRVAQGAMASAARGSFRDLRRLPSVDELREDPRDPERAIELHEVRIEFAWPNGSLLKVGGRDTLPRFGGDDVAPSMIAAARFAHRLAWREALAALLDASARIGAHVPSREQAIGEVADYAW